MSTEQVPPVAASLAPATETQPSTGSAVAPGPSGPAATHPQPSKPVPYQYFVLRAVPRPDRGECVNVGVVLFSEEAGVLAMSWHVDGERVRALDPSADLDALTDTLTYLARICRPGHAAGMARARRRGALFGWLAAPRSTVIQPGPVHGGVSPDPAGEVDRLLRRLVLPIA